MLHAREGIELRVMVKWPITRQRPQQQQQKTTTTTTTMS